MLDLSANYLMAEPLFEHRSFAEAEMCFIMGRNAMYRDPLLPW